MRKIIITLLIGVLFIAGCGEKNIGKTDETNSSSQDIEIVTEVKSNHFDYQFVIQRTHQSGRWEFMFQMDTASTQIHSIRMGHCQLTRTPRMPDFNSHL
ncbi:MAG: hypothetical protein R2883_05685 [Caldisericia bacterium]